MANEKQTATKKLSIEERLIERDNLQKQLLFATEQKIKDKGSDKSLDREILKIELQGGSIIDLNEINKVISHKLKEYHVMFPRAYYEEMFRLNRWAVTDNYQTKPHKAAIYTNEIIYGRFSKDILPTLQVINPYVKYCKRQHKHFQFLTDEGQELLKRFIDEAVETMKECDDWYQFRVLLNQKHKVPYQTELYSV